MSRRLCGVLVTLGLAGLVPRIASGQVSTAKSVVERSTEAMGGASVVDGLRTLSFHFRPQGDGANQRWEIIRPNMLRKEQDRRFILLFDGERAGFLRDWKEGSPPGPYLVPEEDWHHFEMDIALFLPAFLEYPAVYTGQTTIDGDPAHLIEVTLPMGGSVSYAIDAQTFLPVRVDIPAWRLSERLGDYRDVGGVLYPHRRWNPAYPDRVTALRHVVVNDDPDRSRFEFPPGTR